MRKARLAGGGAGFSGGAATSTGASAAGEVAETDVSAGTVLAGFARRAALEAASAVGVSLKTSSTPATCPLCSRAATVSRALPTIFPARDWGDATTGSLGVSVSVGLFSAATGSAGFAAGGFVANMEGPWRSPFMSMRNPMKPPTAMRTTTRPPTTHRPILKADVSSGCGTVEVLVRLGDVAGATLPSGATPGVEERMAAAAGFAGTAELFPMGSATEVLGFAVADGIAAGGIAGAIGGSGAEFFAGLAASAGPRRGLSLKRAASCGSDFATTGAAKTASG